MLKVGVGTTSGCVLKTTTTKKPKPKQKPHQSEHMHSATFPQEGIRIPCL